MSKPQLPEGMTKRGNVYWADFRAGGRRIRKSLPRNLKTAKQLLIELRARAERGEYGLLDNDIGVDELKKQYLRHCRQTKKPGTVERYEFNLAAILPHMPARVSLITVQAVLSYRGQRLADEVSPQHWRDVWYAFLVTGVRESELISLRLCNIDWDTREVVVQRGVAKNHTARRIPVDNGLWEILCQIRDGRGGEDRVFTNTRGGPLTRGPVYRTFIRWCRQAGIQTRTLDAEGHEVDHLDVHSLRRTFATNLIVNGTDPKTVQELLGHKTLAMTMNLYAKIHTGTKRQAISRLPYGAGTEMPEHLLDLPHGHRMSTVAKEAP